jgi:hypothetical protein
MRLVARLSGCVRVLSLLGALGVSSCGDQPREGSLDEIGRGCPATFDGTEAQLPSGRCDGYVFGWVFFCDDLIMLTHSPGQVNSACYYDSSSHQLVGASWSSDINEFCDGKSFDISAGRVNKSCYRQTPDVQRDCNASDGGSSRDVALTE